MHNTSSIGCPSKPAWNHEKTGCLIGIPIRGYSKLITQGSYSPPMQPQKKQGFLQVLK